MNEKNSTQKNSILNFSTSKPFVALNNFSSVMKLSQ